MVPRIYMLFTVGRYFMSVILNRAASVPTLEKISILSTINNFDSNMKITRYIQNSHLHQHKITLFLAQIYQLWMSFLFKILHLSSCCPVLSRLNHILFSLLKFSVIKDIYCCSGKMLNRMSHL